MIRPLAIVSVTGIAISLVCLSLAAALHPGGTWWADDGSWLDDAPWAPGVWDTSDADATRELDWRGGDIEVFLPADVHFQRAPDWRATATGSRAAVARLHLRDGRIRLGGSGGRGSSALEIRLAGPTIGRVTASSSAAIHLEGLDQPSLDVAILGSGSVTASGTVQSLGVQILGSGDAELGGLRTVDLDASILGSGDATVAPTGEAKVRILGSGDLNLATRPRSVASRIMGSGEVNEAYTAD